MTEIAAQVPALFEALSGMPMADLLSKVRKIGDKAPARSGRSGASAVAELPGSSEDVRQEYHGSTRTRRHAGPREPERPDRSRGRSGEDDQAGDPRHGEPAAAGEDAGGDLDGRPAPAAEEAERSTRTRRPSGCARRSWPSTSSRTTSRARRSSATRASPSWPRAYTQQVEDQRQQVDTLRKALAQLDQKLGEARAKSDLLLAQHRRARALEKANDAQLVVGGRGPAAGFDRMERKVQRARPSARPSPSWSPTMWIAGSRRWRRTTKWAVCSTRSRLVAAPLRSSLGAADVRRRADRSKSAFCLWPSRSL